MILNYNELPDYEQKVVMVDGCFDPLHIGHIKYFQEAAKLCYPVLCNIQSDGYITDIKKRPPILPQKQRVGIIDALKSISYVHLCETSTDNVLKRLKPLKYVKGLDWKERGLPKIEQEVCSKLGIEIVYLNTNLDTSTHIADNFANALSTFKSKRELEAFQALVFSQKEVEPQHYDQCYFRGNWRNGNNDYSIEKRRIIEAKNPVNIKEVFKPKRVLDVGCGPGALMYLLWELGIESYGIDFSEKAKELAPVEVKSRIIIASVTEFYDFKMNFDLVICRELLEHLTVLQIKKAVEILTRYTSQFLYITTRFHHSPKGLLDVTNDIATDPTHMTLLNKDFLKTLFVLEGLKPRPDLEEKMDWKKLGRVLVFEKVQI